jgi:hypothetical protein
VAVDRHEGSGQSVEPVAEGSLVDGDELRGQSKEQLGVRGADARAGLLGEGGDGHGDLRVIRAA